MKRQKERRRAGHYLLYGREGSHQVWIYEYLQKHELQARERDGWRVSL